MAELSIPQNSANEDLQSKMPLIKNISNILKNLKIAENLIWKADNDYSSFNCRFRR